MMIASVVPQAGVLPAQEHGMSAFDHGWRGYFVIKRCDILALVNRCRMRID